MKPDKTIAVLLTCHNRRKKTLTCLKALFEADLPEAFCLNVFLVDDGSTDGTGNKVNELFPKVTIIQGTGTLFWNGGMRLAWQTAATKKNYDFYLWLNDDTILENTAIIELISSYNEGTKLNKKPPIICGACTEDKGKTKFSYGGRTENNSVIPDGTLQNCKYINGNVVLIPRKIYNAIGNLSEDYTHAMGDFDYGLMALNAGFLIYTTRQYIATCPINNLPTWMKSSVPLTKRWRLVHSPHGLNLKEYNKFRKKFWGNRWILFALKVYLKVLFPDIYIKLTSKFNSF